MTTIDALREARSALLNPSLSESERGATVKALEGALFVAQQPGNDVAALREALVLTEEALSIHAIEDRMRNDPDDGDNHALDVARRALGVA